LNEKKGHEVAEIRLNLIAEMLQADAVPTPQVAEEARRFFTSPIGGGLDIDLDTLLNFDPAPASPERQRCLRQLHGAVSKLRPLWSEYTKDDSRYFEQDLLDRMEQFFQIVVEATKAVRLRALDELQDPKSWPFDADLSQEHPTNVEAAKAHRVTYSPELRQYVDEDGCPRFDAYGQPL
jgi:hypothetical protein